MSVFSKDRSYQFRSSKGSISDLPSDYWEYLDHMGLEIKKLSVCLEQTLEVEN